MGPNDEADDGGGASLAASEGSEQRAERLRALFDASFEAVFLHEHGAFLEVNRATLEVLRASREQLIGHPVADFVAPESLPSVVEAIRENRTEPYEAWGRRADGELFPAEVRGRTTELGGRTVRVTGMRDLTEQKAAEAALRRSEARYRSLFERAVEGLLVVDADNRVVDANPAAHRLLRYERLVGVGPDELVAGLEQPTGAPLRRATQSAHAEPVIERRMRRGDGTVAEVEVSVASLGDGTMVLALHDLEPRRRAEAEKQALREQLLQSQRLESLGRLAGGVAHDFNNLLLVILMGTEELVEELSTSPLADRVADIRLAAERAAELTRQLLAFGRRQVLHPRKLDVNEAVAEVARLLRRLIGEDIELVIDAARDAGAVEVDPDQLMQVLMNLAVNAREAMPNGGTLRIRTRRESRPSDGAKLVSITVSDSGSGMDAATASRVFEPFFSTKPEDKGSGLGLAIVHGIVTQSGGQISVDSLPGVGTSFRIELPASEGPAASHEPRPSSRPSAAGRIALVEDEPGVRAVIARVLVQAGYDVLFFKGPVEALGALDDLDAIDLVVSDVVMPEMTGIEMVRRLRARRPDLRVLFLSGYAGDPHALGPDDELLQKPFAMGALLERVAHAVRSRKAP